MIYPMNAMSPDALARPAILLVDVWLALCLVSSPLRAEPLDRQVAEWVILMGGSVRLEGQAERIREVTELPAGDFHLELVDLVGTNILPPDLQWLTGLTRLKTLNLPGPMWNPSSGATIDYSRDLRHIAGIRTLEELTFSYTYLESIKFEDDGHRGDRGARPQPPAAEPGRHPGPRPPPGAVHEPRGARPGLLPRERRGPEADAGPDQAPEAPAAGRGDQRRGPAAASAAW